MSVVMLIWTATDTLLTQHQHHQNCKRCLYISEYESISNQTIFRQLAHCAIHVDAE